MTRGGARGSAAPPRRRYHFHTPGLLYTLVTLLLAVGAFNSQNNLLFASLGLAIGGLLVSGILSGTALMGLRLERLATPPAQVGGKLVLRYRATNSNRFVSAFGLTLDEVGGGGANWTAQTRQVRAYFPCIPSRGPRSGGRPGAAEAQVVLEPRVRGVFRVESVRLWTTFPFGLTKKSITFRVPGGTIVHPVDLPVRPGILEKLAVRAPTGVLAAAAPGMGDEFYGLREYADGDNPKWIAWRRSARTGQMVVRQNTAPMPKVVWIVLRLSSADAAVSAERAIALAAALVRACGREGASVGLAIPSHGVAIPPGSSSRALGVMLERLAALEVGSGRDAGFPAQVRGASNVVVHAGGIDPAFGTGRTRHVDVADMAELLVSGEAMARALALLDRSVEGSQRQGGGAA